MRNTLIIMTSNMPVTQLQTNFAPEFMNRIDEVVSFDSLSQHDLHRITEIRLQELTDQFAEQGISLEVTDSAREWLGVNGYQPEYGARPLTRLIKQTILHPASKLILDGSIASSATLNVDVEEDKDGIALKLR